MKIPRAATKTQRSQKINKEGKKKKKNEFSKVSGHKIKIQKSITFLYTNNKLPKKEIKKTILLTIASKRIKYSGINLTKEVKDLYTETMKH